MAGKFIIFLIFGMLLYIGMYVWGSNSDAFKFVEKTVKNSQTLRIQIGEVKHVQLALFGSYSEKHVDSQEKASMTVKVTGTLKTANLNVQVTRIHGIWRIKQSSINGKPILLD